MRFLYTLILFITGWHFVAYFALVDVAFYPSPLTVLNNLFHLLSDFDFIFNIAVSMKRLFISAIIAAPLAILFALISSTNKILDDIINPLVAISFPLPKVAIYPLMLLIFGLDDKSKIALITIGMFYPIFINARLGFKKLIGGKTFEIQKVYPMTTMNFVFHFLLRGSQIEILTGVKIAFNYGLTLVVVSETTASNNGIGYFIWRSWDQFRLINVYSGVFLLSLLGLILYYAIDLLIDSLRKKYY